MSPDLGAVPVGDGSCRFRVWAPHARRVEVRIAGPPERTAPLTASERGYHEAVVSDVPEGARYAFCLDGRIERPDPASRHQPDGPHGASAVVDPTRFRWSDGGWKGIALEDLVFYELHVGTFTQEGTFDGVLGRLDALVRLGVNAIQLMPVAQFPGGRNWGYDGTYPYAVQNSYGGPEGLRRLVDACHARGLAVAVDVVYNHLGPEGNYLADFGPYFTRDRRTPWGDAVNVDGRGSDDVRRFFIGSALHWIEEHHVDILRFDAVHGILDLSARPFLAEATEAVARAAEALGRRVWTIAESDLNDVRVLRAGESGGYGFDGQWNDDFHHALHALVTGDDDGYYADFGGVESWLRAIRRNWVLDGRFSTFRGRRHGCDASRVAPDRFVVFAQNHDQVGNRLRGDRLASRLDFESLKLVAGAVLLSPSIPLLFMGEEWGERAPFLYFVSHGDEALVEAVRRGRREEFADFGWEGDIPDPQDPATFEASRPDPASAVDGEGKMLVDLHRELIGLRRGLPVLREDRNRPPKAGETEGGSGVWVRRGGEAGRAIVLYHFGERAATLSFPEPVGSWRRALDSSDTAWGGPGAPGPPRRRSEGGSAEVDMQPRSFALFVDRNEGPR